MGHVTYLQNLKATFAESETIRFIPEIIWDWNQQDLVARGIYWLLSKRIPKLMDHEQDLGRFRTELALSLCGNRALHRLIPHHQPDVVHIHTQAIGLLSHWIHPEVPKVISIDSTTVLLSQMRPASAKNLRLLIELEKQCFSQATHLISFSEITKHSLIKDYRIPEEQITRVYPTAPLGLISLSEDHLQRRQHSSGKVRLLFVGNDFIRKGGEDLVKVFQESFQESCELDIVSNGVGSLPEIPGIRVHRGLTPLSPALLSLFAEADIFVMPTHEDCIPLVFVEAMAAGLPVIGTTVMAVPEMVRDGINGFTCTPRDHEALKQTLLRLVKDPGLRYSFGQASRKIVQTDFDPNTNGQQITRLFQQLSRKA
jgi:glycosyltransferase involved in cell wall biosynthesis